TCIILIYSYNVHYTYELQNEGTKIILSKCLNCDSPILTEEQFQTIEDHTWTNNKVQLCLSPLINCTNSEKQICTTKLGKDDKNKTSIFTRRPVEPSSGGRKGGIFRDLPQAQFITCLTF